MYNHVTNDSRLLPCDRSKMVEEIARSWLGTPFIKHCRIKKIGCDCVGLIIGIIIEMGLQDIFFDLIQRYDNAYYDYNALQLNLVSIMKQYFVKVSMPLAGCIVVLSNGLQYHAGILIKYIWQDDKFTFIHSCMQADMVIEHRFVEKMYRKYTIHYFTF